MPSSPCLDSNNAQLDDLLAMYDAEFVREAYRLLLGRVPEPQGLDHYLGLVRQGFDKRHILMGIYSSPECKIRLATQPSLRRFFPGHPAWLWPYIGYFLRQLDAWRSRAEVLRRLRIIDNDLYRYRTDSERQLRSLETLLSHGGAGLPGVMSSPHAEGGALRSSAFAHQAAASLTPRAKYFYRLIQNRIINK
jgi:hypothetical protein